MPLIRCQHCDRAYDIPPNVAIRLPVAVATCECGAWLAGSKAAVLARLLDPAEIVTIDLKSYLAPARSSVAALPFEPDPFDLGEPRSLKITTRKDGHSTPSIFTIDQHPLWIGRNGHLDIEDAELSIRHCSIERRSDQLILRDHDSHTGTFLDGEPIQEVVLDEGMHLIRLAGALLCVETTTEHGTPVEPLPALMDSGPSPGFLRKITGRNAVPRETTRVVLLCLEGPLAGHEYDIPRQGLVVGREGNVQVPDEFLSRKHFEVLRDQDDVVRVRDLGSRNGTFLNTLPARNTKVSAGDEIVAGVNRFRVERR